MQADGNRAGFMVAAGNPFTETLVGPSSGVWRRAPGDYGRVAYFTTDGGTAQPPDGVLWAAAMRSNSRKLPKVIAVMRSFASSCGKRQPRSHRRISRSSPGNSASQGCMLKAFGAMTAIVLLSSGFRWESRSDNFDGRPIASVRFIRGGATPDSLFAQVTERRTSKRPFESRPVTSAVLNQLCSVNGTTSWLRASNEVSLVGAIRGIALQAFAIEHTPRIKLEQVRITRFGEDEIETCPDGIGLQGDTVETALTEGKLSRLKLADPNSPASKNAEKHYLALCNTAAAYVWLSTGGNTRHDQLDAGRDWLRVHLKATELGLSFDPQSPTLNDYPEMAQLFQLMHKTLGVAPVRRVQMLSRLGYAAQSPPSPRWAVETRILNI